MIDLEETRLLGIPEWRYTDLRDWLAYHNYECPYCMERLRERIPLYLVYRHWCGQCAREIAMEYTKNILDVPKEAGHYVLIDRGGKRDRTIGSGMALDMRGALEELLTRHTVIEATFGFLYDKSGSVRHYLEKHGVNGGCTCNMRQFNETMTRVG